MLLGVACAAVGVVLTLRPFTSLGVLVVLLALTFAATGASELASAREEPIPAIPTGLAWLVAAVLVVAWAGITIHALAIVAGVSMVVGGIGRATGAIRGTGDSDDRLIAALSGAASVVFGALALSWTDVTVLVIALLVGPRTVLFGAAQIAAAVRHRRARGGKPPTRPARRRPRALRLAGAVASLTLALGLVAASAAIHRSVARPDAFYTAPRTVPHEPGALLREEPFTRGIPPDWHAWRILYTTTRDDHVPALASALVIVSKDSPAEPRPVIAWAHGTTGVASSCAPSLLPSRLNEDVIPALSQVVARGWALVATDYIGLGTAGPHPFLIGQGEARSVLDSVRAVRRLSGVRLADDTVVWGHSQGGHAGLWAAMIAPRYAPDVRIAGIAALAPASDLKALVEEVKDTLEGRVLAAYILTAYSQAYPDVSFDRYVRPAAGTIVRATARRCLDIPEALPSAVTALLSRQQKHPVDPLGGALGERLAQNTPRGPIQAPLFVAQGLSDPLVLPGVQRRFVQRLCDGGQGLDYYTYRGRDHLSLLAPGSPLIGDLLRWTQARLGGRRWPGGCMTVAR